MPQLRNEAESDGRKRQTIPPLKATVKDAQYCQDRNLFDLGTNLRFEREGEELPTNVRWPSRRTGRRAARRRVSRGWQHGGNPEGIRENKSA